jgi:putative hydrolase
MKIVGDYHTHTENSDGKDTIEAVIKAAADAGLKEVAVTDHGHGKFCGGLGPKKYAMCKALIEKAGAEVGIKAYFGAEANITGTGGQIDVNCEEDGKCMDILLCGVHRFVKPANLRSLFTFFIPNWFWALIRFTPPGRIRRNTEAVKRAIAENDIDIWTHPNRYFKLDVVEVAKVCAERGTLVELNGSRISFRPIDYERMAAVGAKFIINSDAHTAHRVGAVDKVYDFLKLCDFREDDIINLKGGFRRGEVPKIEKITKQDASAEAIADRSKAAAKEKPKKRLAPIRRIV